MGYCQSQLGLMKEAVVNYNIALQLNPTDTSSRGLLQDAKNALLSSGETPEFIEELEVSAYTQGSLISSAVMNPDGTHV